jgi:hypothetical protein
MNAARVVLFITLWLFRSRLPNQDSREHNNQEMEISLRDDPGFFGKVSSSTPSLYLA